MRIALISDIHGNLVSLDAVLEDIDHQLVDQLICLGDVVTTGPHPHECVERLLALNCPGITGNHEDNLLDPQVVRMRRESLWAATLDWCDQQLTEDDLVYLRSFKPWIEVPLDATHNLLCFHGSPRSNRECILPTTPDDELRTMLNGHKATLMAGGHTHVQMMRRNKDATIINVGSVGLPFDRCLPNAEEKRIVPWAEYTIVTWSRGTLNIDLRRVAVDFEAIKQATAASDNPYNWIPYWYTPAERPVDY